MDGQWGGLDRGESEMDPGLRIPFWSYGKMTPITARAWDLEKADSGLSPIAGISLLCDLGQMTLLLLFSVLPSTEWAKRICLPKTL